ncbi:substrate-binding domain-containing protein [Rhizobium leguminosarum]
MKCFKTVALAATAVALLASASYAQECAKESVKIGWLPKLDTDPYFQVAGAGAQDAAKEIGGEIIKLAPSQATAEAQVEIVNNLVSQGVKVIALSSNDANAIAPALKRAAKQGVRTVTFDSDAATDARTVFVNQAKGDSLAEMMLQSMHDLIGGEGEFAILSSTATAANQNAWIDFMKQKLSGDPKFSRK